MRHSTGLMVRVWCLAFLALFLTSVRPAHADGTVNGSIYYFDAGNVCPSCGTACPASLYMTSQSQVGSCGWAQLISISCQGTGVNCVSAFNQLANSWTYTKNATVYTESISATGTVCPNHSTGSNPNCLCASGYVNSSDGTTQAAYGVGILCIASGNTITQPVANYSVLVTSAACSLSATDFVNCFPNGTAPSGSYSSAASACASMSYTYANATASCTLVQGTSCVCSYTYADHPEANGITVYPVVGNKNCAAGAAGLACRQQVQASTATADSVAASAQAAAAVSQAKGETTAQQSTAASAAITASNTSANAGVLASQGAAYAAASVAAAGVNGSAGGTVTLATNPLTDYCTANPSSKMCSAVNAGTFSGSCGAAPSCSSDDVVECAIAKDTFTSMCALAQQYVTGTTESNIAAAAVAGTDTGNTNSPAANANRDIVSMTGAISGGSPVFSRAGLSDVTYSTGTAYAVTLPFSKLNSPLTIIGAIGVALTFVFAIYLVIL